MDQIKGFVRIALVKWQMLTEEGATAQSINFIKADGTKGNIDLHGRVIWDED